MTTYTGWGMYGVTGIGRAKATDWALGLHIKSKTNLESVLEKCFKIFLTLKEEKDYHPPTHYSTGLAGRKTKLTFHHCHSASMSWIHLYAPHFLSTQPKASAPKTCAWIGAGLTDLYLALVKASLLRCSQEAYSFWRMGRIRLTPKQSRSSSPQ